MPKEKNTTYEVDKFANLTPQNIRVYMREVIEGRIHKITITVNGDPKLYIGRVDK